MTLTLTIVEGRRMNARQFAELAGVTVRALHRYDRLGLLRPPSGYRVYSRGDLERLEHIVALKFVGVSLDQVQAVLDTGAVDLAAALSAQRRALAEKRCALDKALEAIRAAERAVAAHDRPGVDLALRTIMEVIEMEQNNDRIMSHYSDAGKAKLAGRRREWTPELQEQTSRQGSELIAEVNDAAVSEDAAGERARTLAARRIALVESFTGGDPEVTSGLRTCIRIGRAGRPTCGKTRNGSSPGPRPTHS